MTSKLLNSKLLPFVTGITAGFSSRRFNILSPLANVCVRFEGRAEIAMTGPKEPKTVTMPIIILPIVRSCVIYSTIPATSVKSMHSDTQSSVTPDDSADAWRESVV